MSQRVFVTGGTGYIGSRLIPILAQRGHEVMALVRPGSEQFEHPELADLHFAQPPECVKI